MFRERSTNLDGGLNHGGNKVLIAVDDDDVRVECKGLEGELLLWDEVDFIGGAASGINL